MHLISPVWMRSYSNAAGCFDVYGYPEGVSSSVQSKLNNHRHVYVHRHAYMFLVLLQMKLN